MWRFLLILLAIFPMVLQAQELPPPMADEGRIADTNDNRNSDDIQKIDPASLINPADPTDPTTNNETDEAKPSNTDEQIAQTGTHLLKFEFKSLVQFTNDGSPSPYMEIEYTNKWETPITLSDKKTSSSGTLSIDVQNWGSLAQNEFFDCRLEIIPHEAPTSVNVQWTAPVVEEESDPTTEGTVAFNLNIEGDLDEDWLSSCTDFLSGAALNTQGAPENYNFKTLKKIEPSLSGLIIENFNKDKGGKINLSVPAQVEDDRDIKNVITLSGEGTLSIEPAE